MKKNTIFFLFIFNPVPTVFLNLFCSQLEEAWLDDEHSEFLEQLKMEMLEEQQREEMELAVLQEEQENQQVLNMLICIYT